MAFQNKNLSVLAYSNGFTLWHYRTEDKIEDIQGEYFGSAIALINTGDIFLICAKDGAAHRVVENIDGKNIAL